MSWHGSLRECAWSCGGLGGSVLGAAACHSTIRAPLLHPQVLTSCPPLPSTCPAPSCPACPALPGSKNAAYDFFPCQFQLFYRGRGKGGMWYDPAFQVGASIVMAASAALHCRKRWR